MSAAYLLALAFHVFVDCLHTRHKTFEERLVGEVFVVLLEVLLGR